MLITVIISIVATIFAINYLTQKKLEPVELSPREETKLNKKLKQFGLPTLPSSSAQENNNDLTPEPYTEDPTKREIFFSEKELNAMLAKNTDLAEKIAIDLAENLASAKMLIPLDPDFPFLGGKTLKLKAGAELAYANGRPIVILKGVSVWGVPVPNAWLGNLKNVDLVKEFGGDEGISLEGLFTLESLFTLGMLVMLQAVLGFDNLLYISLESQRVEPHLQSKTRKWGIGLAVLLRIVLLFGLLNVLQLFTNELFSLDIKGIIQGSFNLESIVVFLGGIFLIYTCNQRNHAYDDVRRRSEQRAAMALTQNFVLMATAILIGGILMVVLADKVTEFLKKNRMYEVVGLFILLLVGAMLLSEGAHNAVGLQEYLQNAEAGTETVTQTTAVSSVNEATNQLTHIIELVVAGIVAAALIISVLVLFLGRWLARREKKIIKKSESKQNKIKKTLHQLRRPSENKKKNQLNSFMKFDLRPLK
ncbi:UPF0053 inner membrane protein YoaE [Nymphon striatum]|nr:UPF0053 inner membrane protein YoaE [Nymphon striatum]